VRGFWWSIKYSSCELFSFVPKRVYVLVKSSFGFCFIPSYARHTIVEMPPLLWVQCCREYLAMAKLWRPNCLIFGQTKTRLPYWNSFQWIELESGIFSSETGYMVFRSMASFWDSLPRPQILRCRWQRPKKIQNEDDGMESNLGCMHKALHSVVLKTK